ncbi:MAG: signal peptide peptidase SppA [Acidimicrobiales bacterium]|jgi:protease IV
MTILLELDLTGALVEDMGSHPLEKLVNRRRLALRTLVGRLNVAGEDPDVVGLVAKLGSTLISLAQAQELADAVGRFREKGKVAIAWAETFGELGRGTSAYVIGASFGELWLQPSGSVGLMGAAAAGTFVRGALDRAQVEPLFAQRHEYKNAVDSLMRTEFSDAHREATERMTASAYEQIVSAVARGRKMPEDRVRELVDRAPIPAAAAQEAGLVDYLGYRDEVHDALDRRWPEKPTLLYVSRYHRKWENIHRACQGRRPAVGLIDAIGQIRMGRSKPGPVGRAAGSDTVAAALRAATRDERTKAIVLRVNSPGGSYVASDTIWREVCEAREAGKPVIASMGDVAASGGYFVSMAAEVIVAQAATLTGSIGVFGGKLQTSGLLQQFGLNVQSVGEGRHALMFSPQTGFSESEWAKLNEWLDFVYEDFTAKVASARSMSREAVHEVARGRVWTGADALERGLVDELGGLRRAVEIARERAGLPADAPVRPVLAIPPVQRLRQPRNSDDLSGFVRVGALGTGLFEWGGHTKLAQALGLPSAGPLLVPIEPLR